MTPLLTPGVAALMPLATVSQRMSFGELVSYQLNGLVVVFIALGAIWMVLTVTGSFFKRLSPAPVVKTALPVAVTTPIAPIAEAALDPALLAVIAVAVHVSLGSKARVQKIISLGAESDWAREGRRQIFTSHKVR